MSLAPASSRGFFLNARLAVNGIQCAARSFGTLTAVGRGLLSSMECLFGVLGRGGWLPNYQLRRATGTPTLRDISAQWGMIRKSGPRFSEKIMLKRKVRAGRR